MFPSQSVRCPVCRAHVAVPPPITPVVALATLRQHIADLGEDEPAGLAITNVGMFGHALRLAEKRNPDLARRAEDGDADAQVEVARTYGAAFGLSDGVRDPLKPHPSQGMG